MEAERKGHSGCGFIQRIVAQEHKPSLSTLFSLSPSILMEALRLARRHLLLLPADSDNISYSRRSDSARWASSTRKNFLRFATNNTTEIIRQHYDNKKNNSSDSPGPKAERWTEQKMSLNLATSPRASDQQQTADDGMPLLYEFCQRPFQPVYTCCTCTAPDFTTNHLLLDRMIPGQQPRTTIRRPDQWQRSWRYRQGGGRSNANLHSPVIDHLLPVRQQRYPQALFLQTHMQNTCCGRC